jgi:hypothetical protein
MEQLFNFKIISHSRNWFCFEGPKQGSIAAVSGFMLIFDAIVILHKISSAQMRCVS